MNRAILITLCATLLVGCTNSPLTGSPAQEQMAAAFDKDNADHRREGILSLSRRSGGLAEPYLKAYALLAEDPDPLVRCAAVEALGRAGDPKYLGVILQAMTEDADLRVRIDAATALYVVHGDEAVGPLRAHAASDPDRDIRVRCVRALRHYRTEPVLNTLIAALDDEDYGIRYVARESLREMTGGDEAYDMARWRRMLAAKDDPFKRPEPPRRKWWPW